MGSISLTSVEKWFGETRVIKGIDLEINDREFVVFVGPSGCGKSTLLRMIGGLEDTSRGGILIDGKDATQKGPAERGLSMVFQSYALYPHLTVRENMGFSLLTGGAPKAAIAEQVGAAAKILKLDALLDRRPKELSGGQRQRVAIGRSIVRKPVAFLFDEPLSNLDAALRVEMRYEIAKLHQSLGATMIYVTHDQVEAMTLADRIVVLDAGRIAQVGTPRELYERPANRFVAEFIGSPKMNVLPVAGDVEGVTFFGKRIAFPSDCSGATALGIRPEALRIGEADGALTGRVDLVEYLGADLFVIVALDEERKLTVRTAPGQSIAVGDPVTLSFDPRAAHLFDAAAQRVG